MKLFFTEEQKENNLHKIYLEEDDLVLEGEFVEGEGREFVICGLAIIEGERYHEFEIAFTLTEDAEDNLDSIMEKDWESYDFQF